MRARGPWIVAGLGILAAVITARLFGVSAGDFVTLAIYAGGVALLAGLAGAGLLSLLRTRSISAQMSVVVLSAVAAVAAGATVAANAMFLSSHDLRALGIVLIAAGTAGAVVSLILGRTVARGSESLSAAARRIAGGDFGEVLDRPPTQELADVARELEEMSARLDEARKKERALEASRRELVAWVSHDLRTPLAGIRAMVEALEDGVVDDPETVRRYYTMLRIETDRLAGLVDDLFELSRITSGALQLHMEQVSLGDLVSDALAAANVHARAHRVKLEGRMIGSAPQLEASPPEIARALRNLLENAIRHTPGDGTVTVEAGAENGHAFVRVADQCGGIPASDIERVFDAAFRGTAARTPEKDGGAGLGLAIARGLVEAHSGEISVANRGAGCCFEITLPLHA